MSAEPSIREKQSYATADFSQIALMQLATVYLLFFYTDIIGLSATTIGFIFALSRLWDAVNDPLMGVLIDKTHTRFGRCRPYLIPGSIAFCMAGYAVFYYPSIDGFWLLVYVIVTYNLFNMAFTSVNLPLTAQLPLMTGDPGIRIQLSSLRAFFQALALAGVPLLAEFVLPLLGGRYDPAAYSILALGLGLVVIICFTDTFRQTRERVFIKPEKINLENTRRVFSNNRPLILLLLVNILITTAMISRTSSAIYYFKYVSTDTTFLGAFMTLTTLAIVPASLLALFAAHRIGKRNFILLGCLLGSAGNLMIAVTPSNNLVLLLGGMLGGCTTGAFLSVLFAMQGDIADSVEARSGTRAQAIVCATVALGYKIGIGLGAAMAGWLLGAADYQPQAATQTANVLSAIQWSFTWIPTLSIAVAALLMCFYTLDRQLQDIHQQLNTASP